MSNGDEKVKRLFLFTYFGDWLYTHWAADFHFSSHKKYNQTKMTHVQSSCFIIFQLHLLSSIGQGARFHQAEHLTLGRDESGTWPMKRRAC